MIQGSINSLAKPTSSTGTDGYVCIYAFTCNDINVWLAPTSDGMETSSKSLAALQNQGSKQKDPCSTGHRDSVLQSMCCWTHEQAGVQTAGSLLQLSCKQRSAANNIQIPAGAWSHQRTSCHSQQLVALKGRMGTNICTAENKIATVDFCLFLLYSA